MTDEREPQQVVVMVYRDAAKAELLLEIPIGDLGFVSNGGTMPASDGALIRIAKYQVSETRNEDPESLYYEVTR